MKEVRLRFAPSPTGALHIGGLRTALFNFLLAKKLNGKFILRIEDTDQTRFVQGAEDYIINSLKWAKLLPDEGVGFGGEYGPYRQSERTEIYKKHIQILLDSNKAYYAFDTLEELEAMRNRFTSDENKMPKYDFRTRESMRNSLTLSPQEVRSLLQNNSAHVIRLLVPQNENVEITDVVRGKVNFSTDELDDKVLMKSDGLPTYHFANVVDDKLMKISHVVRGEEWLSSTAHHVLLYRYFGWENQMPEFAHLPLILKPNGQGKLSKRDGAQFGFPVFPLEWKQADELFLGFKEFGFIPEAVLNFLVLLGWNSGLDKEILSIQEMINLFSLEQIGKSGARFDFEKAKWFNSQYIQKSDPELIKSYIEEEFKKHDVQVNSEQANLIYTLYKDRVILLPEFFYQANYLCIDQLDYNIDFLEKKWKSEWHAKYESLLKDLSLIHWNREELEEKLKSFMLTENLKMGEVLPSLRVMLSGTPMGPDIYLMLLALGKDKTIDRISVFLDQNK